MAEKSVVQSSGEALVALLAAVLHHRAYRTLPQANLVKLRAEAMPFLLEFGLDVMAVNGMTQTLGTPSFELACKAFGESLRRHENTLAATTKINVAVGKALKDAQAALLIDPRTAKGADQLKKKSDSLAKTVAAFNADVAAQFGAAKDTSHNQKAMFEELNAIMREFYPKQPANLFLNGEQSTGLKNTNPEKHRRYLDLRRDILKVAKDSQTKIVSAGGEPTMDAQTVLAKQRERGVVFSMIPSKFIGRVDAINGFYTSDGEKLLSTSIGHSGFSMNPKWSPDTDDTYYCSYYTATGMKGVYTESNQKRSKVHKFGIVEFMMDNIDKAKQVWRKDIGFKTKDQILNTIIEVIYRTSARSGHRVGNTAGKPTYGTTTWMVEHVNVIPSTIENGKIVPGYLDVKYQGKKDQGQHHYIKPDTPLMRSVTAVMLQLRKGKKPTDPFWTFDGQRITADEVNKRLKQVFGNDDVTLHKFRHARGTKIALEILDSGDYPFDPDGASYTQKDVMNYFERSMLKIGEALGHYNGGETTWRTAVDAYVDPTVAKQFFDRAEVRVPDTVARVLEDAGED